MDCSFKIDIRREVPEISAAITRVQEDSKKRFHLRVVTVIHGLVIVTVPVFFAVFVLLIWWQPVVGTTLAILNGIAAKRLWREGEQSPFWRRVFLGVLAFPILLLFSVWRLPAVKTELRAGLSSIPPSSDPRWPFVWKLYYIVERYNGLLTQTSTGEINLVFLANCCASRFPEESTRLTCALRRVQDVWSSFAPEVNNLLYLRPLGGREQPEVALALEKKLNELNTATYQVFIARNLLLARFSEIFPYGLGP